MSISEIRYLTEKYLKNEITKEERKQLNFLLEHKENAKIFKSMVQDDYIIKTENRHFDVEKSFEKITPRLTKLPSTKVFVLKPVFKYAAAVVLLVGLSYLFANLYSKGNLSTSSEKIADKQIRLILDDGTEQLLTNVKIDSVRGNNNEILGVSNKGKLHYFNEKRDNTMAYNSLHVPYGKTFQLVLADGSEVFLNAGSSLRYPTNFSNAKNRTVFLDGEAFFKVSKNPNKKFIVNAGEHNIEVLGTEFNVSAYENNTNITTTLREGSVKVFGGINDLLLAPNEQSTWNKTNQKLEKRSVNVAQFTAWMRGQKIFKKTPFVEIMRQLERTYDVKMINTNDKLNNERFTAHFEDESIDQIMAYFSQSYSFKFKKHDNTIIIQ